MTLPPGLQTIAIHILYNIMQSKPDHEVWIINGTEIFFFKNYVENEARRLVLGSF